MNLVSRIVRPLTYRYPVFFDKIRQAFRKYYSKLRKIGYPGYFDFSTKFEVLSNLNAKPANLNSFLFLIYWYETGGAELFALEMMQRLKSQGKKIYVLNTLFEKLFGISASKIVYFPLSVLSLQLNTQTLVWST